MKQRLLLSILMMIIAMSALTAKTIYVKSDATGSDNGTSWADAYVLLQSALDDATAGDEIWVAAGTYKPTAIAGNGSGNRDRAFVLKANVALYGGFAGTESTLEERQLPPFGTPSPTILSGDFDNNGTATDGDAYHVVISAGDWDNAGSVDGFTITCGYSLDSNNQYTNVNDLEIKKYCGAGMCCCYSSPTLTNMTFSDNIACHGGGIFNENSSSTLTNVSISGNEANESGGGICNVNSSAIITNVSLSNNQAHSGGGICDEYSTSTLNNVISSENMAHDGAGIYLGNSSSTITNVAIYGNYGSDGCGIYIYNSSPTLINVTIYGNFAVSCGGGVRNAAGSSSTFINATICGNFGGYYFEAWGGGIFNSGALTLQNTIVWGNNSGIDGNSPDNITYHNCLVQERNDASNNCLPASGISEDEVFINLVKAVGHNPTTAGDYRLKPGSPVINLGDNSFNNTQTDISGGPRIIDGIIDMGAYEYGSYYVITFHSNGGSIVESRYITEGGVVGAVECNRPSHYLENWYTDAAFTPSNIWDLETDPVHSDLDLYAKWIAACTVTFNSNGGSELEPIIAPIGTTIPQPESPIREGYIFDGWCKEAALINRWDFETDIVETNITLYAKWLVAVTVTFSSNGGSQVEPIIVPMGATITQPENPELDELDFDGWYKEAALHNIWNFDVDVVMANITLYAKWKIKGIDDINTGILNIYPNPASGNISLSGINAGDMITITELSGRKVIELRAAAEIQTIDISSLSAGVYLISVGNGVIAGKLVVQ